MKYWDVEQGSSDWWDLRKGIPTSSEFHRIITPVKGDLSKSADKYAAQLIGESLSLYNPDRVESFTNRAVRWGQECEEEARRYYCLQRNVTVRNGGFCLDDSGRFGASPDFLVGEEGTGELKCPEPATHVEWLLDGTLPNDHKVQVHGHLCVTGYKWADFMSYCQGLPPLLIRVEPDAFTEKLKKALDAFHARLTELLAKIAPEGKEDGEIV